MHEPPQQAAGQCPRKGRHPVKQRVLRGAAGVGVVHEEGERHGGVEAGAGEDAAGRDLG